MISATVSRLVILVFGTLYPAYASYKAVRTKNLREYVKWMMHWIVFALFTCAETFTDVLLSFWFPFYYELKIIVVLWLLSPATMGSSILYRKFVHPTLREREKEIDEAIMHAKAQGYTTILSLGARVICSARHIIMQNAIKCGGGLVNQLKKSYSLSDLTDRQDGSKLRAIGLGSLQEEQDMIDHQGDLQFLRRPLVFPGQQSGSVPSPLEKYLQEKQDEIDKGDLQFLRRTLVYPGQRSGSVPSALEMYFSEVDLDLKRRVRPNRQPTMGLPQSLEDVSSGYSSADALFNASQRNSPTSDVALEDMLPRSSSIGSAHVKSRQPIYSGSVSSYKSSEMPGYVTLPRLRRTPRKRITQ